MTCAPHKLLLSATLLVLCTTVPGLAAAQAPDPCATAPGTCATLINTHATAQTRLPNTAVDVSVGITANGRDLATVQRALAAKGASLLTYLRGASAQRLLTTNVSVTPEVKNGKNTLDRTVGYDGEMKVSFRTTPEKAPDLLAGVLDHGANNIDSTNFTPTEEEIAKARRELSAEATRTAIAQGEAIAAAAGLHLASIRTINVDGSAPFSPRPQMYANALMDKQRLASTPIDTEAGEQSLSMQVEVTIAAIR